MRAALAALTLFTSFATSAGAVPVNPIPSFLSGTVVANLDGDTLSLSLPLSVKQTGPNAWSASSQIPVLGRDLAPSFVAPGNRVTYVAASRSLEYDV